MPPLFLPRNLAEPHVGTAYVTDQRVVFMGSTQTPEFAFETLVGYERHCESAYIRFSAANRQGPRCIGYGTQGDASCLQQDLAHSTYASQRDASVARIQQELV